MPLENLEIPKEVQDAKMRFGIIGNAPTLIEAVKRAIKVSPIDLSVLITGESGSGKEFFPKIIHAYSSRKHQKYIAVNCGAIPEGTIDSELFGHIQGAFTGATSARKGYFEEADGGTIFLDEVGELPLPTQARLLRVLESGEYLKVGSSTVSKTNVRIVAATNVNMEKAVAEGKFREDLYYRLSTVQITIPPLRNRGKDISLLARKFARDFQEKNRTAPISFDDSATRAIEAYRWPGNVRQIKNIIDQIALFHAGETISEATLTKYLPHMPSYVPTVAKEQEHSYESERELLFSMLVRLQQEITSLREQMGNGAASDPNGIEKRGIAKSLQSSCSHKTKTAYDSFINIDNEADEYQRREIIDTIATPTTLEANERELIRQSLERNNGSRKNTAKELNISERTLYRKIREFELE